MLGNIGDLFVKCMRQVTKSHLYHLLGELCNALAQGPVSFVKILERSPTGLLIPLDDSVTFCETFMLREREF